MAESDGPHAVGLRALLASVPTWTWIALGVAAGAAALGAIPADPEADTERPEEPVKRRRHRRVMRR